MGVLNAPSTCFTHVPLSSLPFWRRRSSLHPLQHAAMLQPRTRDCQQISRGVPALQSAAV